MIDTASRDQVIGSLRGWGISPSPQRVAIYGFLKANAIHPPAEVIWKSVKEEIPGISLTTVYNTLKLLSRRGVISEVLIEDGELRYDADTSPHAHFKCMECGEVIDLFPADGKPIATGLPELPDGYEMRQIHLCLRGVCRRCNESAG